MKRIHALIDSMRASVMSHPLLIAVSAGVAVVAMVALLVWFIVFSGLSGPIQFVYDSF